MPRMPCPAGSLAPSVRPSVRDASLRPPTAAASPLLPPRVTPSRHVWPQQGSFTWSVSCGARRRQIRGHLSRAGAPGPRPCAGSVPALAACAPAVAESWLLFARRRRELLPLRRPGREDWRDHGGGAAVQGLSLRGRSRSRGALGPARSALWECGLCRGQVEPWRGQKLAARCVRSGASWDGLEAAQQGGRSTPRPGSSCLGFVDLREVSGKPAS